MTYAYGSSKFLIQHLLTESEATYTRTMMALQQAEQEAAYWSAHTTNLGNCMRSLDFVLVTGTGPGYTQVCRPECPARNGGTRCDCPPERTLSAERLVGELGKFLRGVEDYAGRVERQMERMRRLEATEGQGWLPPHPHELRKELRALEGWLDSYRIAANVFSGLMAAEGPLDFIGNLREQAARHPEGIDTRTLLGVLDDYLRQQKPEQEVAA